MRTRYGAGGSYPRRALRRSTRTSPTSKRRPTVVAAAGPPPLARSLRIWLWLATGVAAGLRLLDLGTWSLWIDEAHTFRDATMPLFGDGGLFATDRGFYPVPFLLLRGLFAVGLGQDEGSLRLPFALVGIATVPVLGLLGRRIVGDRAAVVAAWLCALHPWHVYWSQNARGYGLAFLCAAIAVHGLDRWADRGGVRALAGALLALALGVACHPTAGTLLLGLAGFMVVRRMRRFGPPQLAGLAVLAVALLFGLPPAIAALLPYQEFLGSKPNVSLVHFAQTTAYYYRPLLLLAALAGGLGLQDRLGPTRTRLLLCLAGLPLFGLAVVSSSVAQTTARYSIAVFPVLLWLAAALAVRLAEALRGTASTPEPRARFAAALALVALPLDCGAPLLGYFGERHGDRGAWREALVAARAHAGNRRLYVVTVHQPIVSYYLQRNLWAEGPAATDPTVQVHALTRWLLRGTAADGSRVHPDGGRGYLRWHAAEAEKWGGQLVVVTTLPELAEHDDGELWPALQADFDLVLHLPCFVGPKDESLYVYAPRKAPVPRPADPVLPTRR